MRFLRLAVAWVCFAGLMAAIAVPIFFHVRYTPRCTIAGNLSIAGLSPDGRSLLVQDGPPQEVPEDGEARGPTEHYHFKIFDTITGHVVGDFDKLLAPPSSVNGRQFVTRDLFVIDLDQRDHWQLSNAFCESFTPDGQAAHVSIGEERAVVDLTTRQLMRLAKTDNGAAVPGRPIDGPIPPHHERVILDEERKPVATRFQYDMDEATGTWFLASLDRRWLAFGTSPTIGWIMLDVLDPHAVFKQCDIWGTSPVRRVVSWQSDPVGSPLTVVFSAANRGVALWRRTNGTCELKLIDLTTDNEANFKFPAEGQNSSEDDRPFGSGRFSPDGRYFVLSHWHQQESQITMFDVAKGQIAWHRVGWKLPLFGVEGTCLVGGPRCLEIVKTATGALVARLDPELRADYELGPGSVPYNDRSVVLRTLEHPFAQPSRWPGWLQKIIPGLQSPTQATTAVIDLTTGRERLRLRRPSGDLHLSRDGATLAMNLWPTHFGEAGPSRIEIWDVTSHRAYFWAIAWSLSVGIILLLLRRWRLKRKAAV